jgi:uncharacterized phiE125 gp8 family phage protein
VFRLIEIVEPPIEEPVDLAEALAHVRGVLEGDDATFNAKLIAARERGEAFTRRSFCTQTLDVYYTDPDGVGFFELPRGRVQSVVSITISDPYGGADIIMDPLYYKLVGSTLLYGMTGWPTAPGYYGMPLGIKIRIVSGYGEPEDVPVAIREGILEYATYMYESRLGEGPETKYAASVSQTEAGALPPSVFDKWQTYQIRYV